MAIVIAWVIIKENCVIHRGIIHHIWRHNLVLIIIIISCFPLRDRPCSKGPTLNILGPKFYFNRHPADYNFFLWLTSFPKRIMSYKKSIGTVLLEGFYWKGGFIRENRVYLCMLVETRYLYYLALWTIQSIFCQLLYRIGNKIGKI